MHVIAQTNKHILMLFSLLLLSHDKIFCTVYILCSIRILFYSLLKIKTKILCCINPFICALCYLVRLWKTFFFFTNVFSSFFHYHTNTLNCCFFILKKRSLSTILFIFFIHYHCIFMDVTNWNHMESISITIWRQKQAI